MSEITRARACKDGRATINRELIFLVLSSDPSFELGGVLGVLPLVGDFVAGVDDGDFVAGVDDGDFVEGADVEDARGDEFDPAIETFENLSPFTPWHTVLLSLLFLHISPVGLSIA
ncbi:hypothetical protein SUGI_0302510 [Cryptomeria japonica]|nr:hypothetical protein SUGI_0302510 [Cryptomeria japonica]